MLRQRVITAVVMAVLFLTAIASLGLNWLALLFAVVASAAAWEWAPLSGLKGYIQRLVYVCVFLGVLVGLWVGLGFREVPGRDAFQPWLGVACLFWSIAMLLVESYPGTSWIWRSPAARSVMGLLILSATWLSAVFLLTLPGGALLMVLLVLAVAAADIGAYFTGRKWGKHKLAPKVSPGKTWEGLWGGLAGVMLLTLGIVAILPEHLSHLPTESLLLLGLALAGASVLGDLTISMVKRTSGVKDSGMLLPGHGGLLDRIDSLCAAAPVFALGLILAGY